jgi:4'-phosphopantetheinyl transferase
MNSGMNTGGIDLWRFSLDGGPKAVNAALAVLCRDERAQFRQFGNAGLAAAFAIRRAARRIILASYIGIEPAQVTTRDTSYGKPELSSAPSDLYFNASHSKECGILAVTKRSPLGVDIEHLRPIDTQALAARILSPTEQLEFDTVAQGDRDPCMFRVWTAKEALVKGAGTGLDLRDLPLISMPVTPAEVWRQAELGGRMNVHGDWQVISLAPSQGHFISLAAPAAATVTELDARGLLAERGIQAPSRA